MEPADEDPPPVVVAAPADPPAPPSAPGTAPEIAPFQFHGNAPEYFRIWIVNTLLTILTLGIFSAWAKVRKRRYLRGNTELLGHRFHYTGDPLRLLVGHLVVVLLFAGYAVFGAVYVEVRIGALLLFLSLLPWIVVRSISFNAHNTVYRGLRFRFHQSLSAATLVFLLQPLLIPLTLGFYYPTWVRNRHEFILGRHRLGTAYFRLTLKSGAFFRPYFVAGGMMFIAALLVGMLTAYLTTQNSGHVPTTFQLLPLFLIYGFAAFLAKQYLFAEVFRRIWNAATLDSHQFQTRLQTGPWMRLQLVNLAAILGTCGLAYPWATIRATDHVLSRLALRPAGSLDGIESLSASSGSAIGATAAEFAGFDFGL
jgi:uncharacterized membrane protein YjgN (DUF898 family)